MMLSEQAVDEHRGAAPPPRLATAVEASLASELAHFAPPGHKRSARFGELLGADITLLAGVEDQSLSLGLLEGAERDVADAWRAGWARISVQGSSHVNHAVGLALATGADAPGGHVIVARHAHKSVLAGLVLSGLTPAWVMPELDAGGLVAGIPVARVAARLRELPDARAVVLVEPSYTGSVSDLESIVAAAARRRVPVIVDQAWGAHFGFHPAVPPSALDLGAELAVLSLHKTLPALTQASVLLGRRDGHLAHERVRGAFDSLLTTSPSAAIFASVDRARHFMATAGHDALAHALELAAEVREALNALPGVNCQTPAPERGSPTRWIDPLKLVADVSATGVDGRILDQRLRASGVQLSMATTTHLVGLLTVADTSQSTDRLIQALGDAVRGRRPHVAPHPEATILTLPEIVATPREAFLAPHETVPLDASAGRIAGEVVAPYPPGIAAIAPGERITREIVDILEHAQARGVRMTGCADPTLARIRVLR
jgi:arginine decarboxylase